MATTSRRRKTSQSKNLLRKVKTGGQNTMLTVLGFGLAHEVNKYADKLLHPVTGGATSGIFTGAKNYAVPGALILMGIFAPEVSGKYSKYLRPIGGGMAAYGGAVALKETTGKSVLSGTPSMGFLTHYHEPHPAAMLSNTRFPELLTSTAPAGNVAL